MTDGPKKEEPSPAIVKLIESMRITKVLFEVPARETPIIPAMKARPDNSDARTTK